MSQLKRSKFKPLTPKQQNVLTFIEDSILKNNFSPSFDEIRKHFGFASFNSVQRYLQQLEDKGYLQNPGGNQKRALTLTYSASNKVGNTPTNISDVRHSSPRVGTAMSLPVPLLGRVAAGLPLEAHTYDETIEVPQFLMKQPETTFALKVQGQSMIDDGIFDGDTVLVQSQNDARNGEIVVAVIDGEATVKRFFRNTKQSQEIELRPANPQMQNMHYSASEVEIRGIVVGLMRRY